MSSMIFSSFEKNMFIIIQITEFVKEQPNVDIYSRLALEKCRGTPPPHAQGGGALTCHKRDASAREGAVVFGMCCDAFEDKILKLLKCHIIIYLPPSLPIPTNSAALCWRPHNRQTQRFKFPPLTMLFYEEFKNSNFSSSLFFVFFSRFHLPRLVTMNPRLRGFLLHPPGPPSPVNSSSKLLIFLVWAFFKYFFVDSC